MGNKTAAIHAYNTVTLCKKILKQEKDGKFGKQKPIHLFLTTNCFFLVELVVDSCVLKYLIKQGAHLIADIHTTAIMGLMQIDITVYCKKLCSELTVLRVMPTKKFTQTRQKNMYTAD